MSDTCSILFPARCGVQAEDVNGCVLPSGHTCPHEFIATNGRRYSWENDYDCDCEDCQSDEPDNWCLIYWEESKSEGNVMAKKAAAKKAKPKRCNCIEQMNAELERHGLRLSSLIQIDFPNGAGRELCPLITTEWIKPRKKKPNSIICNYCPVCGKKL